MGLFSRFAGNLILFFSALTASASDEQLDAAIAQFERQNYEAALSLLDERALEDERSRYYRGLSLYHARDHQAALPWLRRALEHFPDDPQLLEAAAESMRTAGRFDEARGYADALTAAGFDQTGHYLHGNIAAAQERWDAAVQSYRRSMEGPDPRLAQRAARALMDIHYRQGRYDLAEGVAHRALALDEVSFDALHFQHYFRLAEHPRPAVTEPFRLRLSYRLEHDDNVAQAPDDAPFFGARDESGFRHVLTGDIGYEHRVSPRLSLFAETYLYQSLHQKGSLDDFNFTRANAVIGAGGAWGSFGWRIPLEYTYEALDGDTFRVTLSALPGAYYQPSPDWLFHFFARISDSDFKRAPRPSEDRSGVARRLGLFVHGRPMDRMEWRLIAEGGSDNADGDNWDLDEFRLFTYLEYEFLPKWTAGAGIQYRDRDFDNIHDFFQRQRRDKIRDAFVSLSWRFDRQWRVRAQYSYQEQDSNIEFFNHTRNVFSLGVSWEY